MNEEIEYAEMLEIPVSTVNVVRKKRARKRKAQPATTSASNTDLKDALIEQVNDKIFQENDSTNTENSDEITADSALFAESANAQGNVDFGDIPERIDTVRLYSARENARKKEIRLLAEEYSIDGDDFENEGGRYETKRETKQEKRARIILGTEFAAACALCGAIFLTNVFMPGSGINTFFRALDGSPDAASADTRTYTDFTLSNVVSDFSSAQLTISPTGILSFTEECCVYPAADGKVSSVTREEDGTYTLKIAHSDTFTAVYNGLDQVYYEEGSEVKANVPVAYSGGEAEVQVTMYSGGVLLNCFELTEENCLAWIEQE